MRSSLTAARFLKAVIVIFGRDDWAKEFLVEGKPSDDEEKIAFTNRQVTARLRLLERGQWLEALAEALKDQDFVMSSPLPPSDTTQPIHELDDVALTEFYTRVIP